MLRRLLGHSLPSGACSSRGHRGDTSAKAVPSAAPQMALGGVLHERGHSRLGTLLQGLLLTLPRSDQLVAKGGVPGIPSLCPGRFQPGSQAPWP